ncbi:MAG: hypothetical protein NTU41_05885, partial [Chloroflexi bacterium]|nr:hypothetical protein [Chloroflexota bacterium]
VDPVARTGHEWVIMSGVASPGEWPMDVIHRVSAGSSNLAVFFRDDVLSNMISFRQIDSLGFLKHLSGLRGHREDMYVVTAMDAETFGHHIKSWEKLFLEEVYQALAAKPTSEVEEGVLQLRNLVESQRKALDLQSEAEEVRVVTISDLLQHFRLGKQIEPKPSSWSTTGDDLKAANPYPLWKSPDNEVHQLLWEHMTITLRIVAKAMAAADNETAKYHAEMARHLMDRAWHSDQFWWASRRPHWNINLIHWGLTQQDQTLINGSKAIATSDGISPQEKTEYRYLEIASREVMAQIRNLLLKS